MQGLSNNRWPALRVYSLHCEQCQRQPVQTKRDASGVCGGSASRPQTPSCSEVIAMVIETHAAVGCSFDSSGINSSNFGICSS
jgi:hypothetical protein